MAALTTQRSHRRAASLLLTLAWSVMACTPGWYLDRRTPPILTPTEYELRVQIDDGSFAAVHIDLEGFQCTRHFVADSLLERACILARYDTSEIAVARDPGVDVGAVVAVIWRAVLEGDPEECVAAGFLADRLAECQAAAAARTFTFEDGGTTVRIDAPGGP